MAPGLQAVLWQGRRSSYRSEVQNCPVMEEDAVRNTTVGAHVTLVILMPM